MSESTNTLSKDDLIHLPVGSIALAKLPGLTTVFKKAGWGHWLTPGDVDTISAAEILRDGWKLTLIHDGSDD